MEPGLEEKEKEVAASGLTSPGEASPAQSVLNLKRVPWMSSDEWDRVRVSLFSSSPEAIQFALVRISTWKSRGCLPPLIDVTSQIIRAQQEDSFFREDQAQPVSTEFLVNTYSRAVTSLINAVVETKRNKREKSIAEAAEEYNIPRMLIDVRHECSHRMEDVSLPLLREASLQALYWLKSNYWDPQKNALPSYVRYPREEIDSKLRELALRRCSLSGYRKKSRAILNELVLLYNNSPLDVVNSLLGLLLKVIPSFREDPHSQHRTDHTRQSSLVEWGTLVTQFSAAAPDLLLKLLQETICRIRTEEESRYESVLELLDSPEDDEERREINLLVSLFAWLFDRLKEVNARKSSSSSGNEASSADTDMSRGILKEILRKLLKSASWNKQLVDPAVELARLIGGEPMAEKVRKLVSLNMNRSVRTPDLHNPSAHFAEQEEALRLAAEKLEAIKLLRAKRNGGDGAPTTGRWRIAKSWSACPIGSLPYDRSSASRLPTLSCDAEGRPVTDEWRYYRELDSSSTGKRDISSALGDSLRGLRSKLVSRRESRKRMKVVAEEEEVPEVKGGEVRQLWMNGAWKVSQEDMEAIKKKIQILI